MLGAVPCYHAFLFILIVAVVLTREFTYMYMIMLHVFLLFRCISMLIRARGSCEKALRSLTV